MARGAGGRVLVKLGCQASELLGAALVLSVGLSSQKSMPKKVRKSNIFSFDICFVGEAGNRLGYWNQEVRTRAL
jgi:hypothetical protein